MSKISVFVILDLLSERLMHTFYAPNIDFAERKFGEFLDTLKGRTRPSDFALQCVGTVDDVPESYSEAIDKAVNKDFPLYNGVDVLRYLDSLEVEDESED